MITSPTISNSSLSTENPGFASPDVSDLLQKHEPVVFRGLIADEEIVQQPSEQPKQLLDRLASIVGHRVIPVKMGQPGEDGLRNSSAGEGGKPPANMTSGKRPLSEVVESIKSEGRSSTGRYVYAWGIPVESGIPEILPHLQLPLASDPNAEGGNWFFWLGSGDHHTQLHYDRFENFFYVLTGRKRFTIYPPTDLPDMYVGDLAGGAFGTPTSCVDPKHPDLQKHPRFARAEEHALVIELGPGDAMYLPANWWHHVESIGLNASVNYWWSDVDDEAHLDANAAFLEGLSSLRPLPHHRRLFWKEFFDHFVFQINGDPYEHLPYEQQGLAGSPTPERLRQIQTILASHRRSKETAPPDDEDFMDALYHVSPTLTMRILPSGEFAACDHDHNVNVDISPRSVELVRQFAESTTCRRVLASLKKQGDVNAAQVTQAVRDLVDARVLLPSDA